MRVAVDAMGGDDAPRVVVAGAVQAARVLGDSEIILVGRRDEVDACLRNTPDVTGRVRVEHADEVVGMGESPVEALRKKGNTSIGRCAELARKNEADAILSAGNTGAAVAAASLGMRRLRGVLKPGIAAPFPTTTGRECMVIDVGANIKPKPEHLFNYGVMAAEYVKVVTGVSEPSVGLMNIGEEDEKGNELVKETHALFRESPLNFAGNVEGRDIFHGKVDVVVCDGFVGNVLLKTAEGVSEAILQTLRAALQARFIYRVGATLCKPALRDVVQRLSSSAYGGAQLLGVNGVCIIAHGSSNAKAIASAIAVADRLTRLQINDRIARAICEIKKHTPEPQLQVASS
jgi:glycerol-3-phosphate acyltransferase PlsX